MRRATTALVFASIFLVLPCICTAFEGLSFMTNEFLHDIDSALNDLIRALQGFYDDEEISRIMEGKVYSLTLAFERFEEKAVFATGDTSQAELLLRTIDGFKGDLLSVDSVMNRTLNWTYHLITTDDLEDHHHAASMAEILRHFRTLDDIFRQLSTMFINPGFNKTDLLNAAENGLADLRNAIVNPINGRKGDPPPYPTPDDVEDIIERMNLISQPLAEYIADVIQEAKKMADKIATSLATISMIVVALNSVIFGLELFYSL